MMLYQLCLQAKEFSVICYLSYLFQLFSKIFRSPPLKFSSCYEIGSRVLDTWYYVEKYHQKRVEWYYYQKLRQTNFFKKNFSKCSQIQCFKVRNSTRIILTLRQSPSNNMPQNKSFRGEIMGNLEDQSPLGNMHKFFDCIKTPLKYFLACWTFHREEKRLHHLHKRTNPGSAPVHQVWGSRFRTSTAFLLSKTNPEAIIRSTKIPNNLKQENKKYLSQLNVFLFCFVFLFFLLFADNNQNSCAKLRNIFVMHVGDHERMI